MKKYSLLLSAIIIVSSSTASYASEKNKFFAKIYGGASILSNKPFEQDNIATSGASGDGSYSTGWVSGAALGYHINDKFSAEIAWDYRANDNDSVNFSDGTSFSEGNYASSIFYLNGYYHFEKIGKTKFQPYVGLGIGFVEEVDMDLEASGIENSYTQDSGFAYQFIAGVDYSITESLDLSTDLRYMRIDNIDLTNESGLGDIKGIDYDPVSLVVGLKYKF